MSKILGSQTINSGRGGYNAPVDGGGRGGYNAPVNSGRGGYNGSVPYQNDAIAYVGAHSDGELMHDPTDM